MRTGGRDAQKRAWLLFKARDEEARPGYDVVAARPESVATGRRVTRGPVRARTLRAVHPEPSTLLARVGAPPRGRVRVAISGGRVATDGPMPRAVRAALGQLVVGEAVLDGALGDGVLAARDLLWLDGEDLRARAPSERRELLGSLLSHAGPALVVAAEAPTVALTHPDKVLYPALGLTKADLAAYYDALAGPLVAALAGRPLALQHWPSGIDGPSFFHQNLERHAPAWLTVAETPKRAGSVRHLVVDRPEALRWLAQRAALTLHCWASRVPTLETPDYVVFDLDPADGETIAQAIPVALGLRRLLEELDLPSVPKTSGRHGLHVYVPLAPGHTHEDAVAFAVAVGGALTRAFPETTLERAKARRRGRLYVDCHQNGWGKTIRATHRARRRRPRWRRRSAGVRSRGGSIPPASRCARCRDALTASETSSATGCDTVCGCRVFASNIFDRPADNWGVHLDVLAVARGTSRIQKPLGGLPWH